MTAPRRTLSTTLALAVLTSDIFAWQRESAANRLIVVPTNMEIKQDGRGVMGAGLARVVRDRFNRSAVDAEYGQMLKSFAVATSGEENDVPLNLHLDDLQGHIFMSQKAPLVYFPTKVEWRKDSIRELIAANLDALASLSRAMPHLQFGVPMLGVGNGGLPKEDILNLITEKLAGLPNIQVFDYERKTPVENGVQATDAVPTVRERTPVTRTPLSELELDVPEVPQSIVDLVKDKKVLVVSGHRPNKLGGFSPQIRQYTREVVGSILDSIKPDVVVEGAGLGIDRAFAEMAEERGLILIQADACRDMESRWQEADKAKHAHLAAYAHSTGAHVIVTDAPYEQAGGAVCMEVRNRWMLEVLAVAGEGSKFAVIHDGTDGGTSNCKKAFVRRFGENARALYAGNYWKQFSGNHPMPAVLEARPKPAQAQEETKVAKPQVKVA